MPSPLPMRTARRLFTALLAVLCLMPAARAAPDAPAEAAWAALRAGAVVLFRHADAPGVGDPPGFRLGDCSTQRNLDAAGRAQARRIGEGFRAEGVKVGRVLSSQWCRTHETAELAFPRQVQDDEAFNSFFGDGRREAAQSAAALAILRDWRGPGALVVVTHQVNITALTGVVPASGEGVVVRPTAQGIEVVARLVP